MRMYRLSPRIIRTLRKEHGWTRNELAARTVALYRDGIGTVVRASTIRDIERGRCWQKGKLVTKYGSERVWKALARALECSDPSTLLMPSERPAQIPLPTLDRGSMFTSRFARTPDDLEIVLTLRRGFFEQPIVSDETYRICWHGEHDSMKIVFGPSSVPLGYWGMFPIDRDTYKDFLNGKVSSSATHQVMLTQRRLPWPRVNRSDTYLYIVGMVVPRTVPSGLNRTKVASAVIKDLCAFGITIFDSLTVKGVCAYASRDAGEGALENIGFQTNGVVVDNNADQLVRFVDGSKRLQALTRKIEFYTERLAGGTPVWDEQDRKRFLARIRNV